MNTVRWRVSVILCSAGLLAGGHSLAAQQAQPKLPALPVIEFKLHPAKASAPALKYRLLPEVRDLQPGNAALLYYRALSPEWWSGRVEIRKLLDTWHEDVAKSPPSTLRFVLKYAALAEVDRAARRTYCDWELAQRLRKDGLAATLPELQSFREIASLLAVRTRFAIVDRQFDRAANSLQTGFAFSRHLAEGPSLIQSLIAASAAEQMLREVEQFVQQPGAPNLYWSLTDLPTPLVDIRKGLQGEKLMIDGIFPGWREMLANVQAPPLSLGELKEAADAVVANLQLAGSITRDEELLRGKLGLALVVASCYPEARDHLLKQGRPRELVDQMPVTQVALLYQISVYDRFYDDLVKWYGLPYEQMRQGVTAADQALRQAKATGGAGTLLATYLLPAVNKVLARSYQIDRKLALLRCVEAVRLHAADNGGKLPGTLKDVTAVPLPLDPFTGKAFEYQAEGNTATLTAPVPHGEGQSSSSWQIAITLQSQE